MDGSTAWDWAIGRRWICDLKAVADKAVLMGPPCVSPDGEMVTVAVRENETVDLMTNGRSWGRALERVWRLQWGAGNQFAALAMTEGEWTVLTGQGAWEERFEFIWNPIFSSSGEHLVIAAQSARRYRAVCDDIPWENDFLSLSHLTISPNGAKTAAVIQTEAFGETDIAKYQKGCYTVGVNGHAWPRAFVNIWDPVFDETSIHLAAGVRTSLHDYTIAVDGVPWTASFAALWEPCFVPDQTRVTAPVRVNGAWRLYRDGEPLWERAYCQLWHHRHSPDGQRVAAIVAPRFGRWTVALDDRPWRQQFDGLVTDLVFGPDSQTLACIVQHAGQYHIAVDGHIWATSCDMLMPPVISPDSRHVAARGLKDGAQYILVDGSPVTQPCEMACDPVFSPDSRKLLVKGIERADAGRRLFRQVIALS